MASSSFSVGKQQRGKLQHQFHIRYVVAFVLSFHCLYSLCSLDDSLSDHEDPLDIVKLAWMDTWKTESYENLFQGLLEPQISCREGKASGYIDPDTIHCPPLLLRETSLEKGPEAKTFWSRTPSVMTDIDFDYGTEIGRAPEEWPNISGDADSVFEATAISLENFLLSSSSAMFSAEAILRRRAKLIDVSTI